MSDSIEYGIVGAMIIGGDPTGVLTVNRHLLVVDALGLQELAKNSLPEGYSRVRSFIENRHALPAPALARVARDLSKAVSPITDQLSLSMESALTARVGVARSHHLSSGVFLMAAFKGNTVNEEEEHKANVKINKDFQQVGEMLSEHKIRAWVTKEQHSHKVTPLDESLDLQEKPCLECFSALCHKLAEQMRIHAVESGMKQALKQDMKQDMKQMEAAALNPHPVPNRLKAF